MGTNILLFLGGIGPFELMFILLFVLVPFGLWLWALVDLLKSDFKSGTDKLIWAMVVIFLPVLGVLLYFLIGRSSKVSSLQ